VSAGDPGDIQVRIDAAQDAIVGVQGESDDGAHNAASGGKKGDRKVTRTFLSSLRTIRRQRFMKCKFMQGFLRGGSERKT